MAPPSLILALLACSLAGCVAVSRIDYPKDWAQAQKVEMAECPHIAGEYEDAGTLRGQAPFDGHKYRNPNAWHGGTQLLANLVGSAEAWSAPAIELSQPDPDTLIVQVQDGTTSRQWTLTRSRGDFDCNASGVTMSATGSFLSGTTRYAAADAFMTALGVLVLSGGVVSHTRSFRPLEDGALLMEVTQNGFMAHGVVLGWDYRSFVRWERRRGAQGSTRADAVRLDSERAGIDVAP